MAFFPEELWTSPPSHMIFEEPESPPWFAPPRGVLGGLSAQRLVLFRSADAVLTVSRFEVYPAGLELTIDLRVRTPGEAPFETPWERMHRTTSHGEDSIPDDFLRLGFALDDDRRWVNFLGDFPAFDEVPRGPLLMGRGGGGGGTRWEMRYWLWPLPATGDITFYAKWPVYGIEEVSAVLDGDELRAAAGKSEVIWP